MNAHTTMDREHSPTDRPRPEALRDLLEALEAVAWHRADLITAPTAAAFCKAVQAELKRQEGHDE